MSFDKLPVKFKADDKTSVANLHKALGKLNLEVADKEKNVRKIEVSTVEAIKTFQKKNKLTADGKLNDKTIAAMNVELHDNFVTASKYRTSKLHNLLQRLDLPVDKKETANRKNGETTRKAIAEFQLKNRLPVDGKLSEDVLDKLEEAVIKQRLTAKTQIGVLQKQLQKVNKLAGLNSEIAPAEIESKQIGATTKKLIENFQKKYRLPVNGTLDKKTLEKIDSVAASKGTFVKRMSKPKTHELKTITKPLSINKRTPLVNDAQKSLSFLGYKISAKEFNTQTFGKTTRKAVVAFQKSNNLPETGMIGKAEMKVLNQIITEKNPNAAASSLRYHVRGSVRDELWQRKGNMVIRIYEKLLDSDSETPLASKTNFPNGFFDLAYIPPINPIDGQIKEKFHLTIKFYEAVDRNPANDKLLDTQIHYNVKPIHWANFTEGGQRYAGKSDYELIGEIVQKAIGGAAIVNLHETETDKQISHLALQTGLDTDTIMRLILAYRVAASVNKPNILTAEVFYAFLRQNLPPNLPGDLLRGTSDWETIEQMTELAANGIVLMSEELHKEALETAISQNLVTRKVNADKDKILLELKRKRTEFTLQKPILVGDQNLKTLLDVSEIKTENYPAVANLFIANKGINEDFWKQMNAQSGTFGAAAVADFSLTVELGNITKNHLSTVEFFKGKVGAGDNKFKTAASFAKLSQTEIAELIKQNGDSVPANMPGNTTAEKVTAYAATIKNRAEIVFPTESLIGEIGRTNTDKLPALSEVEKFIDDHTDLDLRNQNVDKYLQENDITLENQVKNDLKVVQRVRKLTSNSPAGATLVDEGLHSSMQIYFTGQNRLENLLKEKGVAAKSARQLYEASKLQYLQIIGRLFEFRREPNFATPQAIIPQYYTQMEIQAALGDIPNLEMLFGSLDFCECEHCKSLYSPAAYFTDLLRFLSEHDSLINKTPSKKFTVKEILFQRRPDLGNIKLNCENTNTPLPFIDLVCEILENYVTPKLTNFTHQTTLTAKELRAIPQYVRSAAYKKLAVSDFPMNSSFNLFQEEARVYLNYLRVPRWDLMETFQNTANPALKIPNDAAIAAEFFGISEYEKRLIITTQPTVAEQDGFWNLNTTLGTVAVDKFCDRAKLSYNQLLELLLVRFVNNPNTPNQSEIVRPVESCDTSLQNVNNLTPARYDLMHRFLRLWRKTGWQMWELDLLVRNPKIGNNTINGNTLVNLKRFRELQTKLKLPFETLLAFYGNINREMRVKPEQPDVKINPLYVNLFQNIAVTNPIDEHFRAVDANDQPVPLDSTIIFGINAAAPFNGYTPLPTILSTLAIAQTDFDLIVGKTNNHLSVNSLSILLRYVYLARGLRLSIKDLLSLLAITNVADPFADLQTTHEVLKNLEYIKQSKISLLELDYILNYAPDSSVGLREETLVQLLEALRATLDDNKNQIDKLALDDANRAAIENFDADALVPMTNANLLIALAPLQNTLNAVSTNFNDNGFSPEETTFILNFAFLPTTTPDATVNTENAATNAANKTRLIESIETLQANIAGVFEQNRNRIKAQVASAFNLTDSQANILLANLKLVASTMPLLEILEDESLIAKNADGAYTEEINRTNFPAQFNVYLLLHKVSLLVARLKITDTDLEWFIVNDTAVNSLDFSALPISAALVPNDYAKWLDLFKFLEFKNDFPEPENASLRSILDLGKDVAKTKAEIFTEIAELTQWSATDLTALDTGFAFGHVAGDLDYAKADTFARLKKCFDQMKLTGVDAKTMFFWAIINNDLDRDVTVSVQTRQAVKSKYEQEDWLSKIKPLHDDIREKKRFALVEYHIENSQRTETPKVNVNGQMIPNPLYWKDALALYKYFLIDVEMSACQMTSRIKQAISSVQFFVQRCFLNLENRYVKVSQDEKEDVASPNAWSQWKWMKNYRVWEANRKIFFYPENWIEPELRDDKSPFFKELEDEIMQNEITKDNVEEAFINYLQKVDEVSHLEVCGLYHELENLSGDASMYEINTVHVIGRTKAIPHIYYYRSYDMNYDYWSAWEKIEVEIQGDQVMPVVYNRKLHLFWLQFMEKPMKMKKVPPAKATNGPTTAPEPMKLMEIQLGWTIKKTSGWTPKKISKQKLIHPWERPHYAYNLKPYYLSKFNELYVDIYLSTTKEFNDGKFYDPQVSPEDNPVYLTKNRWNETLLPWHSSSFVFNGDVKEVKLKGLGGAYLHFYVNDNNEINASTEWSDYDSFDYVHQNFGKDGEKIKELNPVNEYGPRLRLPSGMHYEGTRLTNNKVNATNASSLQILENNATVNLLSGAIAPFELVITQQDIQFNASTAAEHPFFYQDSKRAFFIKPEWENIFSEYGQDIGDRRVYRFLPFYHPYTMLFIREFNRDGIDGLLRRKIQTQPQTFPPTNNFNFNTYAPNTAVTTVDPTAQNDNNDFSFGGAYSLYNWELFFHAPLMIACRLMQNQKFEDALAWFHYIFDPTNIENLPTPQRYWITKPFFETSSAEYRQQRIENILIDINKLTSEQQLKQNENGKMLIAWRNDPFNPHLIARYRPVAYQKSVVMKYLDNLIAWGDMLFGRDTLESINEAALLYLLAYEILGDRPQKVPNVKHEELTFNQLEPKLDEFGNARVDVVIEDTLLPIKVAGATSGTQAIPKIETFYFCIPPNDFLTKYWDTVEDRLFKIRHCMNIQGVVRQLPLFEPPIDPALLVKAAAAGIDLSSVLNDLAAPTPHYRFRVVVQKAVEFCKDVQMLGEKLLGVLEKKDAEELALMRSQHEIQMLEAVKDVFKKQIDEAVENIGSLNASMDLADAREIYYNDIPRMNDWEIGGVVAHGIGIGAEIGATIANVLAAGIYLIPQFPAGAAGMGGSPTVLVEYGGDQPGKAAAKFAAFFQGLSAVAHSVGSLLEQQGNYTRRDNENIFQAKLAGIEKNQIRFQLNAAEIRQSIAEKELENHELQIENAKAVDDFMKNKYTNRQLFSWMITQISTVYFQSYQLAFEMAKKAEKCFQYELGLTATNYIQFGYWDSLKKGLLAGDKLLNDLRRLEAAYLDQNKREFEITKHVSLAQMFPAKLIELRETGKCTLSLPEWIFDLDYPGHYMRRIKNVSISIPCIVGPFTSINCTLSLIRNETRISSVLSGGEYAKTDDNDDRFRTMFGAISSIATSHAQNDSGMFELNFNDDRYLPFEGAGLTSEWQIDLPIENNQFDFASLSDVILHVNYTARNGGGLLADGARANLDEVLPDSSARLFSLKHEFSSEWYKFLHPENNADQEFIVTLKPEHYPFFLRGKLSDLKIKKAELFVETDSEDDFNANVKITNANSADGLDIAPSADFGGVHHLSVEFAANPPNALGEIRLKIKLDTAANFKSLADETISDLFLLLSLSSGG